MTRIVLSMAYCLVPLALIAAEPAGGKSKPAASKPKATAAKPDSAKAKSKPAAAKPKPAKAEAKPAAVKPQPATGAPKPAAPSPASHTVKPELFKIDVALDGVFEAQTMTEIALRPKAWAAFKVLKAVEHGQSVHKGDVLVQFDPKDIDRAVADGRTNQQLSDLSFEQAQLSLQLLEKTTPMEEALAERGRRYADEDLARFLEVERQMRRKSSEQSLKSAENTLEYQLEELRQLEKMYKADDLTEETEEIILKRQRDMVERYKYYLEQAKIYHDETLKVSLPRSEESIKYSTQSVKLTTDKAKATLRLQLRRQQIDLEKMKVQRTRDEEKLKKLLGDQALMAIKAPVDGMVYYGRWARGQWSGGSSMADKLKPGQSVTANSVLMTLVKARPLTVRVTVPENQLHWIRTGLKATVQPVAYPDLRAAATVASVNTVPAADGKFVASLRVVLDQEGDAIMPGMKCKVKLVPYLKRRTLTVPVSAVKTDELDDQRHYVHLIDEKGKSKKQQVTVGKKTAERMEILDGLVAGDKVLKAYPKDK